MVVGKEEVERWLVFSLLEHLPEGWVSQHELYNLQRIEDQRSHPNIPSQQFADHPSIHYSCYPVHSISTYWSDSLNFNYSHLKSYSLHPHPKAQSFDQSSLKQPTSCSPNQSSLLSSLALPSPLHSHHHHSHTSLPTTAQVPTIFQRLVQHLTPLAHTQSPQQSQSSSIRQSTSTPQQQSTRSSPRHLPTSRPQSSPHQHRHASLHLIQFKSGSRRSSTRSLQSSRPSHALRRQHTSPPAARRLPLLFH